MAEKIKTQEEHALYLLCSELFRVIDLLTRYKGYMLEVFSRFRTRNHFDEMLKFRFFEADLALMSRLDPEITTTALGLYNYLYELRVSLKFTSALPPSVEMELTQALSRSTDLWNTLAERLKAKYGWEFARL